MGGDPCGQYISLKDKRGREKQKSSRSGKLPESKKNKELSDVQITAHGRG
jgi:hypothetical protein